MLQKCSSGHIQATQKDVLHVIRKIIQTGTTKVGKRKTAPKDQSQFVIKTTSIAEILDETFDFDDDVENVGTFNHTKEDVKITVNNKVTTCVSEIEVCCKILPAPPVDPPTTPTPPTSPFIPVPAPKYGIRNEDGLLITAEFPSDGRARLESDYA